MIVFVAVALALFLAGAEFMARLDDYLHQDTPLTANPDRWGDLTVQDQLVRHGRPDGRFKKWKLNAFGFRSPEKMDLEPLPGVTRILILGASETFGQVEADGKEYPAQLADQLRKDGIDDVEVVNAGLAGITLKSLCPFWEEWASRFHPQIVFIYPSPHFYLDEQPPQARDAEPDPPGQPKLASRFAERVKNALRTNSLLRKARLEWNIASTLSGKSSDWLYREVPADRLQLFLNDLAALVDAVRARGARPVLLTHAIRSASPMRPEDRNDVREFRLYAGRATEETLVAFEDAVNAGIKRLAEEKGITVIDVASKLSGHREWFGDLVHFNDAGAGEVARLLAKAIEDPKFGLFRPAGKTEGAK